MFCMYVLNVLYILIVCYYEICEYVIIEKLVSKHPTVNGDGV